MVGHSQMSTTSTYLSKKKKTNSQTLFHDRTFNTKGIDAIKKKTKKKQAKWAQWEVSALHSSSLWDVGEGAQF